MKPVRTRFAPSPTGFLHVGGVRTAIFAWLLARHHHGQFLLRIEDTDQERLVEGAIRAIIEDLTWLGIEIDEGPSLDELKAVNASWPGAKGFGGGHGPYIQSLRREKYRAVAEDLVARGFAYRCDCTPERLQKEREEQALRKEPPGYSGYCRNRNVAADSRHVIRLRIPENETIFLKDAVKGDISWQSLALRDPVLLKSDGFPTYHLAVVVDDHEMEISHVLRGDEWVPSAPIHVLLYRALGWEMPVFAHLPNVLGQDGKKLSKRHGATNVNVFREAGYLPEALLNFLVLIGWSPGEGEEQEIFSVAELQKRFSLEHVNNASGVFSYDKLNWMNGNYIRALPVSELQARIKPVLDEAGLKVDSEKLKLITPHIQERIVMLKDAVSLVDFLFMDQITPDLKGMMQKGIDSAKAKDILTRARAKLFALSGFECPAIEATLREIIAETGLSTGGVFGVIRIAVTGKKVTPPLFESIHALGKDLALKRIDQCLTLLVT